MPFCKVCGNELASDAKFCNRCGSTVSVSVGAVTPSAAPVGSAGSVGSSTGVTGIVDTQFTIVTTPTIPGYRITKVIGVVSGLTPRTRGVLGKFIGGLQSMVGGEVTAFTSEIEKARLEAFERMKAQARALGANAIVGVDVETADLLQTLIVLSVTGTAVVIEPEAK